MDKKLEDAKEILEIMIKNLKEYGIYHAVTDNEQQAISTVLQALEYYKRKYEVKELQLHLLKEETNNEIENSIPKEVVEKEIKKLKEMKVNGEVFTTSVNFAVKILEGILEGK